jgi:2,5-furandicarboxylate decarboxylase 1
MADALQQDSQPMRATKATAGQTQAGMGDGFRLRTFVEHLVEIGEVDIVEEHLDLIDVAARLDGNPKAVLFKSVGPDQTELVGNVVGGRKRLAAAFGVGEQELLSEVSRRLKTIIAPVEMDQADAPVQQIVLTGDDADFTRLPIHLQHELDGGPYVSASIDVTESVDGTLRNIGYRRLMIRGRKEAGIDLIAPSDMRAGYTGFVEQKRNMPVAFVVGSHPADCIAAVTMIPTPDEFGLAGALRGEPVPLVKCRTNDLMVPADAEVILEGYIDDRGWCEPEGPFGEYLGYYGHMKTNPVFHLTAITMRRDALFQTVTISGRALGNTDTAQLCALRTEVTAWTALESAIREPVAIYCPATTGGMYNLRVSMRQRYPGESRNAIAGVFACKADVKNVFVVDDDIDVFSDEQIEWALATRFQGDRDLVVATGLRTIPLDPSLLGSRTGAKTGFDLTIPFGSEGRSAFAVPEAPKLKDAPRSNVMQALQASPKCFKELMDAMGSRDGRDTVVALDEVRKTGRLTRTPEGRYALTPE